MLKISAIPIFTDNYIWVLEQNHKVIAVDPGDAAPLQAWLSAQHCTLAGILITHHHADHTAGLADLAQDDLPIYGPAAIQYINRPLLGGESLTLLGENFRVLATPGHTLDHLCYYGAGALFSGDTLFSGGCGRVFEGSMVQMYQSLQTLSQLPSQTLVCCTHEYTMSNLQFALAIEPENTALQSRAAEVAQLRAAEQFSLPSTLSIELASNPFLRCNEPAVIKMAQQHKPNANSPAQVFASLREWKNNFR